MKKFLLATLAVASASLSAGTYDPYIGQDITAKIPEIPSQYEGMFEKIPDVAQYKNADWDNVIGIAHHVSLAEAQRMAAENPEVTFFFYMTGVSMVLEREDGTYRHFVQGDAVFFSGTPWWGSAAGYADGYVKKSEK
jgi:hypothetical protein